MSSSSIVHSYQTNIGQTLTYKNDNFYTKEWPSMLKLRINQIPNNFAVELINSLDKPIINDVAHCLLTSIFPLLKYKGYKVEFEPTTTNYIPQNKPTQAILLALNSGFIMTLTNNRQPSDVREIYVPKNSLIIIDDPNNEWSRSYKKGKQQTFKGQKYDFDKVYTLVIFWDKA
jgi:hypothetical protein